MTCPLEVGSCNEERLVYALYSRIKGFDADLVVPKLHTPVQERCGREAGRMLRKLHSVKCPEGGKDGYAEKIRLELERFSSYAVNFRGDKEAVDFLKSNEGIAENRPVCAIHGNYGTGSLVIDKKGGIGIIGFGSWAWGDPVRDFARTRFSCSKSFMKGLVGGYIEENIPEDFFKLMAYYTAADVISEINRAYLSGGERLEAARRQAETAAREYNGFGGTIPSWY